MSRRHRKLRRSAGAAGADSLDLLLGPMCNTFGGIVLTAVVLALLSHEVDVTAASSSQQARTQAATATTEMMQRRLAKADEDLARAQAFALTLEKRAGDPTLGDRLRLAAERVRLREDLQVAQRAIETGPRTNAPSNGNPPAALDPGVAAGELKAALAPIIHDATEQENIRASLDENIDRLRERRAALETQLRAEKDRSVKKWRLPKERAKYKDPYYVVIRFGAMYPRSLFRNGLLEANAAGIDSSMENNKVFLSPRPGRGLDPQKDGEAIDAIFQSIPRQQFYIAFLVYQDSFGVFDTVKQRATQLDLDYGWDAFKNSRPLVFAPQGQAPAPPQ